MNHLIAAVAATLVLMVYALNALAAPNCVDYITADRAFHNTRLLTDAASQEVTRRAFFSFGAGSPGTEAARNVANSLTQDSLRVANIDREIGFLQAWTNPIDATQRAVPSPLEGDQRAAALELAKRERRRCGSWRSANPRSHAPSTEEYRDLRESSRKTRHNANCIEYVSAELRMKKAIRNAQDVRKRKFQVTSAKARDGYQEIAKQASASKLTYDDAIAEVISVATDHWRALVSAIEDEQKSIDKADTARMRAELSAWANPIDAPKRNVPPLSNKEEIARIQTIISFEREYCKDPGSKIGTTTTI